MSDRLTLPTLPLVDPHPAAADWHGFQPVAAVPAAALPPEPDAPQGAYSESLPQRNPAPAVPPRRSARPVELLAPAGGPDAGYAALHFGADAIYLGLQKFSARAEAENFTLDEVDAITAYAHALQPRRKVFVTINTLIRQDELGELVESIARLAEIGVDALIIQDLGVYHLVRASFPNLELHGSTQLAVHNRAGAEALGRLGFRRVVLARELTFEEVHAVTATAGIETEVFIHGALCYAYSGLCLFSSQTLGRSGNRGKCAYSCRDSFDVEGAPPTLRDGQPVHRDPRQGFPFSMKDLALPDHLPSLREAGVSCFKIEGRKKSPLYVATTTDYYRRLLDGRLDPDARPALEADLQTVFSRPWTQLFVDSHRDKEVADRDTVGHRGAPIGQIEAVRGGSEPRLRFHTNRALEKHDGLQVDLPGHLGKPFGFPIDRLWIVEARQRATDVLTAPAGACVEVGLPREHPPLPIGAPVYCSSSQAVKQHYRHGEPKPGAFRTRRPIRITLQLTADELTATGTLLGGDETAGVSVQRSLPGPFAPARDAAALEVAARAAFDRLGDTQYALADWSLENRAGCFVPASRLNALRRDLVAALDDAVARARHARNDALLSQALPPRARPAPRQPADLAWSIKVDRIGYLDALTDADLANGDEIIVDIARDTLADLESRLPHWASRVGADRLRLALPPLTRKWEEYGLLQKITRLRAAGWRKWEASNLSAWTFLGLPDDAATLDLASDWSVYVLNRLAARALLDLGVTRFTLSPEDGLGNLRSLLAEFAERAVVIVHQDTPLFLAESCAYANLIGGCPGKANCRFESMELISSHGERVTALDYHCRTIVLNKGPFCLSTRLRDLAAAGACRVRADFVYRPYSPAEVQARWRQLRAGRPVADGHAANFDRGVL